MKIKEASAQYLAVPADNDRVQTYEGPYEHPKHGSCVARIHRAVRNDNGTASHATVAALKAAEPYGVGMWPGDVLSFFSEDGYLLGVEADGD